MKKIDLANAPAGSGTRYPAPYDEPCKNRRWLRVGDVAGLTQFGVNIVTLDPGVWSSQRHWHEHEDEFVFMLEGELVLITDSGEEIMRPGDCAGFKAGVSNGHQLVNRSQRDALYLEIGTRAASERAHYPDVDLVLERDARGMRFLHKSGEPYPQES